MPLPTTPSIANAEQPPLRYATVCSGINAPAEAWNPAPLNWQEVFCSEIEPFPCAVLKHHHPDVPNLGDMTKFHEWPDFLIRLLCGGTPCQSFSVAGLRAGLADPRGNLMLTYLAIAQRYMPQWLVWENVPGVLSSNGGRDFGTFLAALGKLGYGWAYRVLDAQYFGVAQRRRRVFVVAYLGDWRRAAAVLFERESLLGHPAPSRTQGKGIANGFECGPQGGGLTDLAPTLDARCKDGPIRNQLGAGVLMGADITGPLCNNGKAAGSSTQQDAESNMLVAAPLTCGNGHAPVSDGIPANLIAAPLRTRPYADNIADESNLVPQ